MLKKTLVLFVILFIVFFSSIAEAKTRLDFPDPTWQPMTLFQARINWDSLKRWIETPITGLNFPLPYTNGRLFISRFGYRVYGINDDKHPLDDDNDISSAFKVFLTHFLLYTTVDHPGLVRVNLNDNIVDKCQEWMDNFFNKCPDLIDSRVTKNLNIKWSHFANETSNYGVAENPGAAFSYNDYQTGLFWELLVGYLYKLDAETVLQNYLFSENFIGNQDGPRVVTKPVYIHEERSDIDYPEGISISPRDFARFGLLYLNRGKWQTTNIIDKDLVRQVTSEVLPLNKHRSHYVSDLIELSNLFRRKDGSGSGKVIELCDNCYFYSYKDPGYRDGGVMYDVVTWNNNYPRLTDEQIDEWDKKINIPVENLEKSAGNNVLKSRDQDDHYGCFGWMWWKYGEGDNFWTQLSQVSTENRKYAKGFFAAIGKDGRDVLLVFPRLNLVVTWLNVNGNLDTKNLPINGLLDSIYHELDSIVVAPNGGETLNHGASYKIMWDAFEFSIFEDLDILLYKDGNKLGRVHPITPFIGADTEEYNWNVGTYYDANNAIQHVSPNTTGYKIEISSKNGDYSTKGDITDQSNDTFSIGDPLPTYTITATAGAGGTISPSGSVTVIQGQSKTFTIAANSGYAVQSVTVDGNNQGASKSFTFSNVQANHSIAATFVPISITILTPNGGENWQFNTYQSITWNAPGITGNIQLSLYRNGKAIGWIANYPAASGTYSWKVGTYEDPQLNVPAGSGYSIKINSWDGVYIDASNAPFNIFRSSGSLTLTAPNGGENWQFNTYQNITWSAPGVTGNIALTLYRNGSAVGWIANCAAYKGTYSWKVGTYEDDQIPVPVGSGYAIVIGSMDGSYIDESNAAFNIVSPGIYITLTAPNGGESWKYGTYQNITWNAQGISGNIVIILYRNGAKVAWLANWAAYKGTFDWRVGYDDENLDLDLRAGGGYSILIKSGNGVYTDTSDGTFTVY